MKLITWKYWAGFALIGAALFLTHGCASCDPAQNGCPAGALEVIAPIISFL